MWDTSHTACEAHVLCGWRSWNEKGLSAFESWFFQRCFGRAIYVISVIVGNHDMIKLLDLLIRGPSASNSSRLRVLVSMEQLYDIWNFVYRGWIYLWVHSISGMTIVDYLLNLGRMVTLWRLSKFKTIDITKAASNYFRVLRYMRGFYYGPYQPMAPYGTCPKQELRGREQKRERGIHK